MAAAVSNDFATWTDLGTPEDPRTIVSPLHFVVFSQRADEFERRSTLRRSTTFVESSTVRSFLPDSDGRGILQSFTLQLLLDLLEPLSLRRRELRLSLWVRLLLSLSLDDGGPESES